VIDFTERCEFLIDNLDLPAASGVETARWEPYQLAHLSDDSVFRIEDKSRQIAWSFTVAVEAVADAVLTGRGTVFVSINLDEAMEKIRYARACYENLQIGGLPRLVRDNELSLEFDNGARLLSLPSRPPRGKARMNVVLDEFAHVQHDRDIYKAALPIISKGGRLRIGSSPLGASGVFWELFTQSLQRYPGYSRRYTPWWAVQAFCVDVRAASRQAPNLPTAARVEHFGNDRIKAIFANMLLEDFQQEYEGEFVDESTAWITWEVIQRNQAAGEGMQVWRAHSVDEALALIDVVHAAILAGQIEPVLVGGIDVGRKRDLTELMGLGVTTTQQLPVRLMVSLANTPYDDQQACFRQMLERLPWLAVLVDRNGIGAQLAEHLEHTGKAQGVDFTNQSKQLWAVEARIQAERVNTPLPPDRDVAYQIHSIKKKVTAAKNNVFDTERNEKHHADKFWAWALAIWAAVGSTGALEVGPSPLTGYRG
jgi:phage FluMu gp28-like protein